MTSANAVKSPAQEAADKAQAELHDRIAEGKCVLLEAGAGAGKTYSLVEALRYLIESRGAELLKNGQQIACITYTNVASDEITSRTDGHPAVLSATIHSFCWSLIKDFQPYLRAGVPALKDFAEKLADVGGTVGDRRVEYDLGYRGVSDTAVTLRHDDVISLTVGLMDKEKFRSVVAAKFPIIFIDEYQDTNKDIADAIKKHFLDTGEGPLVCFFGDHWQKIYSGVCGKIEHASLAVVNKGANFRSAAAIVDVLNKMRPELEQAVSDTQMVGSAVAYHTNSWVGERRSDSHWKGDLPEHEAQACFESLTEALRADGWDFSGPATKVLMLTNNLLAKRQGYGSFGAAFPYAESYLKKEDPYIEFLTDTIEPVCDAYSGKRYGEMFALLSGGSPGISNHREKRDWKRDLEALIDLRGEGTIGDVLALLRRTRRPRLPERLERREAEFESYRASLPAEKVPKMETRRLLGDIAYKELVALDRYIDDKTPFSTKHGVKGAEFENVLVVVGRGWNLYDFNQMLEWVATGVPSGKESSFERNRNLFYVSCSRPRRRLAVLFTQKLSERALGTLRAWFGDGSVRETVLRS